MGTDRDHADLMRYISTTDARCPGCDYNLGGLLADRCPECGRQLTVRGLVKHRHRSPIFRATGFGLLVSGVLLCLTCYGALLGLVYLAFFIDWSSSPVRCATMGPGARRTWLVLAWTPAVLIAIALASVIFMSII